MERKPEEKNGEKGARTSRKQTSTGGKCEDCEFYDYDESDDTYSCRVALDEDEMAEFVSGRTGQCPYFRFYDEYKSVRKQI